MKRMIYLAVVLAFVTTATVAATPDETFFRQSAGVWSGTLEYSDYQTGQRVKLTTLLTIEPAADGNSATFTYLFDDFGKVIRSAELHRIDPVTQKYYVDEAVFSYQEVDGKLVLLGRTLDNDRDEPVRETVSAGPETLSILKETRSPYQFRHQYDFHRSQEYVGENNTVSPSKMAEDIAVLKQVLVTLHPGIFRYITTVQLEAEFAALKAQTSAPLPEDQFFKLIAQTVSFLKCGHTYLNPLNQNKSVRERLFTRRTYLPFYFRLLDRPMIVTGNVSSKKIFRGSEIVKINGIPVTQITESLLSVTTADGNNTQSARLKQLEVGIVEENREQLFDFFFPIFFPMKEPVFTIEAVDYQSKKPVKFQVLALTKAERRERTEAIYGTTPTYDDGWNFAIGTDGVAILLIGNFITWRLKTVEPKKFLADAFARLRAEKVKSLIVDLRGNSGGDTDTGFELARYLARKPLPPYIWGKRLVRNGLAQPGLAAYLQSYSAELKAQLISGIAPSLFRKSRSGYFEILPRPELESYPAVKPYPDRFGGDVFFISDSSNASAAFQFFDFARSNHLGTIVGQETGGNRQGINGGNFYFLTLPNSGLEIDVPAYFQAPLKPAKDSGIVPDLRVNETIEDIAAGRDAEVIFIKEFIRSKSEKSSPRR